MYRKLKTMFLCMLFVFIGSLSFSFCSDAGWIGPGKTTVTLNGPSFHTEIAADLDTSAYYRYYSFEVKSGRDTVVTYSNSGATANTLHYPTSIEPDGAYWTVTEKNVNYEYLKGTFSVPFYLPYQTVNGSALVTPFDKDLLQIFFPMSTIVTTNKQTVDTHTSLVVNYHLDSITFYYCGEEYTVAPNSWIQLFMKNPTNGLSITNNTIAVGLNFSYDGYVKYDPNNDHTDTASWDWNPVIALSYGANGSGQLYYNFVSSYYITKQDLYNQTNSLEYDYDNSNTMNDNTNLNNHLDQMDQAEDNITSQGFTNIDNVSMVDVSSSPAMMLTALSFCSSFLQSLFINIGVFSYWVLISLSMTLALIIIGWMRFK